MENGTGTFYVTTSVCTRDKITYADLLYCVRKKSWYTLFHYGFLHDALQTSIVFSIISNNISTKTFFDNGSLFFLYGQKKT